MRFLKLLIVVAVILGSVNVLAQNGPPSDTLLDHMAGKWLLKGTIAGNHVAHDITAAWILGHQYIQIKETSREKKADGSPAYDAIILITLDRSKNQYDCLWLDNTSNAGLSNGIIAHAPIKSNEIALLFKYNNTSYFHTTLTYDPAADSWHWYLTSDDNGKVGMFADAVMGREQ